MRDDMAAKCRPFATTTESMLSNTRVDDGKDMKC